METWFTYAFGALLGLMGLATFALLRILAAVEKARDSLHLMRLEQEGERRHQEMLRFHEKAKHTHLENMRRQAVAMQPKMTEATLT